LIYVGSLLLKNGSNAKQSQMLILLLLYCLFLDQQVPINFI